MLMHVACGAALLTRFRQSVSASCKVKCALSSRAARDDGDDGGREDTKPGTSGRRFIQALD
jgi:hypothetical protein